MGCYCRVGKAERAHRLRHCRAIWWHGAKSAFAHPPKLASPPLLDKLVLGVMAAHEHQNAGDQRQRGEHQQTG